MASPKQPDLESQKPAAASAAPSPAVAASVSEPAEPPSNVLRRTSSDSVAVGITTTTNGHDAAPETEPLLAPPPNDEETTRLERAMSRAFRSTADLAKHLPTGAVLVFEILSPVFTNGGKCDDVNRAMTSWLVGLCAAACFLLCFTDSFVDGKGTARYVVATRSGLWVIDGTAAPPPAVAAKYRLRFIDFFHAALSLVVFMSVAAFDRNVAACFVPVMSYDTRQVLTAVPLAGGLVGTLLFAAFPSTRHGLGFPIPAAAA